MPSATYITSATQKECRNIHCWFWTLWYPVACQANCGLSLGILTHKLKETGIFLSEETRFSVYVSDRKAYSHNRHALCVIGIIELCKSPFMAFSSKAMCPESLLQGVTEIGPHDCLEARSLWHRNHGISVMVYQM